MNPRPQSANRAKCFSGKISLIRFYPWMLGMKLDAPLNSKRKNNPVIFPWHHFPSCNQPVWKKMTKNISEPPKFGSHWAIFFNLLPRKRKNTQKTTAVFLEKILPGHLELAPRRGFSTWWLPPAEETERLRLRTTAAAGASKVGWPIWEIWGNLGVFVSNPQIIYR